jgi:Protein of unknown function, DUF255
VGGTLVNWLEWNGESFAKAQAEDKPILLDLGAVWCHWRHRMDADTYNQPQVATFINENFIPVKVDNDKNAYLEQASSTIRRSYNRPTKLRAACPKRSRIPDNVVSPPINAWMSGSASWETLRI